MPRNKCPWFKMAQKPVRPGVYSVKAAHRGRPFYRYFDGKYWGRRVLRIADAKPTRLPRGHAVHGVELGWRGVLK